MKVDRLKKQVILDDDDIAAIIKINKAIELIFEVIKLIHSMSEKEFNMLAGSLELTYEEMTVGSVLKE